MPDWSLFDYAVILICNWNNIEKGNQKFIKIEEEMIVVTWEMKDFILNIKFLSSKYI